ncbi:GIY-YIG nuclease family protein [Dyella amyloliquefaciens]|uniref:GIY-YIG nuclease family protein n=1 Tax=Dyella amyloliquefaciens TaxID=1770545 RepID=UPI00102E5B82|nr:GIY-YIG nuclease family protein [Dyella amyloliquefaciens]
MASTAQPTWWLYLIECQDGSYYAGITNDLDARYAAHASGRGARYTRSHPPLRLLGSRAYDNRSQASRAEWEIKQLPKHRKLGYLTEATNEEAAIPDAPE